jgi:hypothetical protein
VRTRAWWTAVALLAVPPPAPAQQVPETVLHRSAEAVDKATQSITSLQADYIRTYNVYGRVAQMTEEGRLFVRRTPEGRVSQRWEGKDEKGPVVTLVRDRDFSVWRGKKKEISGPVADPGLHHPVRFGFPFLPPEWKTRFVIGPPFISPEFDDRWPKQMSGGVPVGLTFGPREGTERYTFKLVTFLYEEKLALPYRYRCDTYGWQLELVDCDNWVLNPELPAALFEPPDKLAEPPSTPAPAGGEKKPAK